MTYFFHLSINGIKITVGAALVTIILCVKTAVFIEDVLSGPWVRMCVG